MRLLALGGVHPAVLRLADLLLADLLPVDLLPVALRLGVLGVNLRSCPLGVALLRRVVLLPRCVARVPVDPARPVLVIVVVRQCLSGCTCTQSRG